MSRHDVQYHDSRCICPYCGEGYDVESEDYSEDPRVEECGGCGKRFHFWQVFSVDHVTTPDCELNGGTHEWVDHKLSSGDTHPFCSVCGECQSLPPSPEPQLVDGAP